MPGSFVICSDWYSDGRNAMPCQRIVDDHQEGVALLAGRKTYRTHRHVQLRALLEQQEEIRMILRRLFKGGCGRLCVVYQVRESLRNKSRSMIPAYKSRRNQSNTMTGQVSFTALGHYQIYPDSLARHYVHRGIQIVTETSTSIALQVLNRWYFLVNHRDTLHINWH